MAAASRTASCATLALPQLLLLLLLLLLSLLAVDAQPRAPLHILAFGDSLTQGTTDNNSRFYPYGAKLQQLLQAVDPNVLVEVQGLGGERVVPDMRERLLRKLQEAKSQGIRYEWVLILGGINDLVGYEGNSEEVIFQSLRKMYDACLQAGSHVVAMTVLEHKWTATEAWDVHRHKLNHMIREYALRHAAQAAVRGHVAPRLLLLDLARLLPYVQITAERRTEVYDDGVHLTEKGYDIVAQLLAEVLSPALAPQGATQPLQALRQR